MAENDQNPATETPIQGGESAAPEPSFALQRLYLKDASFESPGAPAVFQNKWNPRVNFDIKSRSSRLQDEFYEVVLVLTIESKQEDKTAYLAEVHQAGIFLCRGLTPPQLEQVLATMCPTILFPYAREAIDALVVKGSFPAVMLAPINFDALYAQRKQQQAAQAAQAAQDTPAADSQGADLNG